MDELIDLAIMALVLGLPLLLFVVAWFVGSHTEARHFASIRAREAALAHLPAVPIRTPEEGRQIVEARLVTGSVVIANDNFKRAVAALRSIFGGRLRTYESLVDRARREAILRMKEEWPEAHAILNLRLETSTIGEITSNRSVSAFEVLAYGTAIRYA